jgi:hypothetical protein
VADQTAPGDHEDQDADAMVLVIESDDTHVRFSIGDSRAVAIEHELALQLAVGIITAIDVDDDLLDHVLSEVLEP